MSMKEIKVRITFTEEVLGSSPANPEIYSDYIGSKSPDASTIEEEVEALGADAVAEKQMTIFPKTKEGAPFIYDYQIRGYFKEVCGILKQIDGTESSKITANKKLIDNYIYVTNLEPQELCVRCYPELYKIVEDANKRNTKLQKKELPKYSYPVNVLTAAMAYQFSHYGIEYALDMRECVKVEGLDEQRKVGKAIFGKGFLLSEKAAAEKAAAEKAAAEKWTLSEREKAIIRTLGK